MENIIRISKLSKTFKDIKAVSDLSFRVKKGELFAFLGVNGAGKSTTISIICGTLQKDGGTISVCGENEHNLVKAMSKTGVVFQNSVLDSSLTVKENLLTRAAFYGITGPAFDKRLQQLDSLMNIKDILSRPVGKLSGGQKRKADVARALLHNPELLILDEPTTGLDPMTRKTLWDAVLTLRKEQNMTVFLTTHYMEEAVNADYVVIIDEGKIAAEGTPNQLKNMYAKDYLYIYNISEKNVESMGLPYEPAGDGYRISVNSPRQATQLISSYPHFFNDYEFVKGKMDDVFLAVTGKKTEEQQWKR